VQEEARDWTDGVLRRDTECTKTIFLFKISHNDLSKMHERIYGSEEQLRCFKLKVEILEAM